MKIDSRLIVGAIVGFSANHLKNTGQHAGRAPMRRGELLSIDGGYCRVRWTDVDYAALALQWGEDYADDARANGQLYPLANLAVVSSPRFVTNDL